MEFELEHMVPDEQYCEGLKALIAKLFGLPDARDRLPEGLVAVLEDRDTSGAQDLLVGLMHQVQSNSENPSESTPLLKRFFPVEAFDDHVKEAEEHYAYGTLASEAAWLADDHAQAAVANVTRRDLHAVCLLCCAVLWAVLVCCQWPLVMFSTGAGRLFLVCLGCATVLSMDVFVSAHLALEHQSDKWAFAWSRYAKVALKFHETYLQALAERIADPNDHADAWDPVSCMCPARQVMRLAFTLLMRQASLS
jgi:hypothetical protein